MYLSLKNVKISTKKMRSTAKKGKSNVQMMFLDVEVKQDG